MICLISEINSARKFSFPDDYKEQTRDGNGLYDETRLWEHKEKDETKKYKKKPGRAKNETAVDKVQQMIENS